MEQEVLDVEIVSFEVDNSGKITVKLNKEVKDVRFKLNGTLVNGTPGDDNTYTIESDLLEENKENTLVVTDEGNTFEQSKTFVYKKLVGPTSLKVAAESGNAENEINSSNAKDVGIIVTFNGGNTNKLPVILEVTITDKDKEGNVKNTLTLTKELTSQNVNEEIRGDLSSLEEGELTLTALVKDDEGNVSEATSPVTVAKFANAPVVTYESVTRENEGVAKIKNLKSTNTESSKEDTLYYLVKGIDEPAPTVAEVIGNPTSNENKITSFEEDTSVNVSDELKDKACIIYVVARTKSGTDSENVVAIKVAKPNAPKMEGTIALEKSTGKDATYTWNFDENTEGFVEYRVILKDSENKIICEKVIKKGEAKEIDFFEVLKKQKAGTYKATVTAVADNVNYTDVTSSEVNITTSPVLTAININLDSENKTISWTTTGNVANVENYTVEILKYDSTKEEGKEYENVVSSAITTNTSDYDISSIVEKNGAGTYSFRVTANAKENVLMSNYSSADIKAANADNDTQATIKYYQGARINDLLAEIKDGKVVLKGTLLEADKLFDIKSSEKENLVKYTLYYTTIGKSYAGNGTAVAELPFNVTKFNPGTEYKFMVMTEVKGNKYYSNEPSVKTPLTALVLDNAKYKKLEEGSQILPALATDEITYKDGILYVGTEMTEYSSEVYPVVAKIASILEQMGENDKISANEDITALKLVSDTSKATTYDLSQVPATAKVEITGKTGYKTTVKGALNEITLKTSTEYDLSGLSVTKVNANADAMNLTINSEKSTNINFTTGTTATINGVKLTQITALAPVTIEGDTLTITGSDNKLTIDSSKVEKDISIKFVGTNQKGLVITANKDKAVKVLTNSQEISGLEVKSGKVDVSNAVFTNLVVGGVEGINTVTLVTDSSNTGSAVVGKNLTTDPTLLDWLGYYLTASVASNASYSVNANSKEIVFTLNDSATVTLNKKSEDLEVKYDGLKAKADTVMNGDRDSENVETYKENMDAIKNVVVDKSTNTITVTVNGDMQKYTSTADHSGSSQHAYYSLLIDVGVPRDSLLTGTGAGQKYYELTEEDKNNSEKWGASETEVIVWLYAEDAKTIVDFVTTTGEHLYFTVIVEGYQAG